MLKRFNSKTWKSDSTCDTGPPTALIADDDPVVRSLTRHTLKNAGFKIIEAENGVEALEQMTSDVSVVLLDLNMPEMDGLTCLKHLQKKYKNVSPVMITASDDVSDVVKSMQNGALDYIVKPVDLNRLVVLADRAHISWMKTRRLRQLEEEVRQARKQEIEFASRMQSTLLMGQQPKSVNGMEIARLSIPSGNVEGDFLDFLKLNDESLDIITGDVTGKGIGSALLGAAIKNQFLRIMNELILENPSVLPDPADIISRLYQTTIDYMKDINAFVSAGYARIDMAASRFIYMDCGHMRTIRFQAKTQTAHLLKSVHMAQGVPEIENFKRISIPFAPGDYFLFYSRAVTETLNPAEEMFGEHRLIRFVEQNSQLPANDLIRAIRNRLFDFSGSDTFEDDFVCVITEISPPCPV